MNRCRADIWKYWINCGVHQKCCNVSRLGWEGWLTYSLQHYSIMILYLHVCLLYADHFVRHKATHNHKHLWDCEKNPWAISVHSTIWFKNLEWAQHRPWFSSCTTKKCITMVSFGKCYIAIANMFACGHLLTESILIPCMLQAFNFRKEELHVYTPFFKDDEASNTTKQIL